MHINRDGWSELCREALSFLKKWPELCHFSDQSALNAVASGHHKPLSLRWNFPIFFRNIEIEEDIAPSVYHFMSQPKPWHGSFLPWDITFTRPYTAVLRADPVLAKYVSKLSRINHTRYIVQQWLKRVHERALWNQTRRRRILAYEAMTGRADLNLELPVSNLAERSTGEVLSGNKP